MKLPLIRRAMPQMIANQIVGVQPMSSHYVKPIYLNINKINSAQCIQNEFAKRIIHDPKLEATNILLFSAVKKSQTSKLLRILEEYGAIELRGTRYNDLYCEEEKIYNVLEDFKFLYGTSKGLQSFKTYHRRVITYVPSRKMSLKRLVNPTDDNLGLNKENKIIKRTMEEHIEINGYSSKKQQ